MAMWQSVILALLAMTLLYSNCPPPPGSSTSVGEWFAPDGTTVHHANNTVPGFRRNRGRRVVRLYRNTVTGPPAEGIYYCRIKDDTNTWQIINVGLYNSAEGIIFHLHSYDLHNYIYNLNIYRYRHYYCVRCHIIYNEN